ncbi:Myosin-M heavy protein [Quillaja saponaria]|uniref:Myosin-M heavy protein n=1 Tax=Quillaja saponaria TaxID=32244 RepID=A0AAD7PNJ9_QUISA|nr:Myosin-M heavy protein [Quillaja saponaria]
MGRQTKAKKPDYLGKGKVTPIQVAFIVDQYLGDNNYSQSRSVFRNEASSLIANSPTQAPNNLLSLGDMLNEYISLKEQKVMLDQERVRVGQERCRIQMLLQGMQNVMSAYNANGIPYTTSIPAPAKVPSVAVVPQPNNNGGSPSGCPMNNTLTSHTNPPNVNREPEKLSSSISNPPTNKRKETRAVTDAPSAAKRSRVRSSTRTIPSKGQKTLSHSDNAVNAEDVAVPSSTIQSSPYNCVASGYKNTPQDVTPTCCTVISSKRVMVSPMKQMALIESNRCISSCSPVKKNSERASKRDHVRSRLDFDGSNMPMSLEKPAVDEVILIFTVKKMVSLASQHQVLLRTWLQGHLMTVKLGSWELIKLYPEISSTVTQILSEKDMNVKDLDSLSAVKSVTKSIRIWSPVKNCQSSRDQENCTARV